MRRSEKLAWRRVLDETVVLDLSSRQVFGLDEAGAAWLDHLGVPRDRASLIHSTSDSRAADEFLDRLLHGGVLQVCDEEAEPLPGSLALPGPPRVLWTEPLPRLAQQASPAQEAGDITCFQ